MVNAATELLPNDMEVQELARRYLGRVDKLLGQVLRQEGFPAAEARRRGGAMLALATGAVILRKAGAPSAKIRTKLDMLSRLLA